VSTLVCWSDITSNVRALNYALSHPLVFTDTCMAPPTTRKKQPSFQPLTRVPTHVHTVDLHDAQKQDVSK